MRAFLILIPLLVLAACAPAAGGLRDADALIGPEWHLSRIALPDGSLLVPTQGVHSLQFEDDGIAYGRFDCNQGSGHYTAHNGSMDLGPMTSTLMACPPGSIAFEFTSALEGVFRFEGTDTTLVLYGRAGTLLQFGTIATARD